jgi:hypothetical protein
MRDRRVWEYVLRGAQVRGAAPWFWSQFTAAARAVVLRWGPRWCRPTVLGEPLGVWLLVVLWWAPPLGLLWWLLHR